MNRHLYNITPSAQAETFVLIRGRKKYQHKLIHSCQLVKSVGKPSSAQAEAFVQIRAIRGQTNQRKLKHSCKFVKFVGEKPSAQAENIRAYSCNSWANPSSAQAEKFVPIRTIRGQNPISAS
ncbi:hypothetical protein [Capnocytophaga sputigena]|uniref:hypothetical protein n=1 Tax=Capnocytophaga sputigena TaxID=1019 RepID=UPI00288C277F|nr:hypothetical protein [Capnocytophaga sputigena]